MIMDEKEMTGLLLKLADLGVTGIKIHYEGGGDSGCIEDVVYTTEPCATPEDVNDRLNSYDAEACLAKLDQEAYDLITSFAESKVLDDVEDWWNNDGGFGDMCICVPSGKYIVNNSVRIMDTEDFFHDGDLISKTLE